MAGILEYLEWRADVPLSADPFNEADNLVLAELAYTDFSDIVPGDGTEIPLYEVDARFFAQHTVEEIRQAKSFTAKAPLLLREMAAGARFRDARLCWYIDELDPAQGLQLSAIVFRLSDGSAYVAFRGTDGTIVGWKEDFDLSFLPATEGQQRAVLYLDRVGKALDCPLRVGGHSKGGNLAVYAAAHCQEDVRARILNVYSSDGPGFRHEFADSPEYQALLERIVHIVPDTSIIGLLLTSKSAPRVVKSAAMGILQHDGFTWEIRRNRFVPAQLSAVGEFLQVALGSWLEQMDDEARRAFTDTVFSLFEATGEETFSGISGQGWKAVEAIAGSLRDLPRDRQQEVLAALGKLLQSGGSTASAYLTNLFNRG